MTVEMLLVCLLLLHPIDRTNDSFELVKGSLFQRSHKSTLLNKS